MNSVSKADINKVLGETFKEYRLKNNLTQEQIAEKLEISVKYISRIENGNGGVKVETLVKYMNILGISPNVIFSKLIINTDLKPEMELAEKARNLSTNEINFITEVINLLENLNK